MVSSAELEITLMMILVASSCSMLGTLVFLNREAYIPVSLGKSTILGFGLGFIYSTSFSSIPLIILAFIFAMLTLKLSKKISTNEKFTLHSLSISISSIFFAVGVAIISLFSYIKFTEEDRVFTGDLVYSIFNRLIINGEDYGAIPLYLLIIITLTISITIIILFNKLKVYTLDKHYANAIGIDMAKLEFIMTLLISLVVAVSIQVTGAFMVAVFILGPVAIAYFFCNRLNTLMIAAVIICFIASLTGIRLANAFNITIVSATVTVIALLFFASVIFAPENGVVANVFKSIKIRKDVRLKSLIAYLYYHENTLPKGRDEFIRYISSSLKWGYSTSSNLVDTAITKDYLLINEYEALTVSDYGKQFAYTLLQDIYG